MNIYDISKEAGVSIATVSRVLNKSPKVSEKTRKKILDIISRNNYIPANQQYLHDRDKMVGIFCNSMSDSISRTIIRELTVMLHNLGFCSTLFICDNDLNEKKRYMELSLSRKYCAGFVINSDFLEFNPAENQYIYKVAEKMPLILLNVYLEGTNLYSILVEKKQSIYTITDNILSKGRLNPLFLFHSMSSECMDMLESFKSALNAHGIEAKTEYTHLCKTDNNSVALYLDKLNSLCEPYDAIITTDDILAAKAVNYLHSHNISIPDDIDVTGCGNTETAELIYPSITTIDCHNAELCKLAVTTLNTIINYQETSRRTILTSDIITHQTLP